MTLLLTAPPRFTDITFVKIAVLSAMFLISLSANSAVLLCIGCRRRRRRLDGGAPIARGHQLSASSIDVLIGHLAMSDLIVTFFCNVTDVVWELTVQWIINRSTCTLK